MKNYTKIQSPLKDQKKSKGFVLVNNSISDYQSYTHKSTSSKNYGGNIISFLGKTGFVIIMFAVVIGIKSISTDHNSNSFKTVRYENMQKAQKFKEERNWRFAESEHFAKFMEKSRQDKYDKNTITVSKSDLAEFSKKLDNFENKLDSRNLRIQGQNKDLEYLKSREKARQLGELGNMITTFNNMGIFSFLN